MLIRENRFVTKYFLSLENILANNVRIKSTLNPSDKGENAEELLLDVLNNHLPNAARAYRGGIILDCNDRQSNQVDIAVYSNWSPLLHQNKKPVFLAEGTYAAIEVKSTLTKKSLIAYLHSSAKIKRLRKFLISETAPLISSSPTSKSICTGIFAYSSRIKKPKTIHKILMDYQKIGVKNTEMPDFICINGQFCFQRLRTEDVVAYSESGLSKENKTLKDFQEECRYVCLSDSLAMMFDMILNYVSYTATRHLFGTYIHTRS